MIKKKKPYFVYMHLYKGKPVYIGKGTVDYYKCKRKGGYDDRAKKFNKRNQRYTNFINEVGKANITIKIVARFDDESEALWLEDKLHEVHNNLYSLSNKEVAKLNASPAKPVVQLTLDGEFIREYESEASTKVNGFSSRRISECCNGKRKLHKGYKWMFAKDYYLKK